MSRHSDILIIGAGPGGYETAADAARRGLKVTLIEKDKLGGTCLNRGCIPTKCLCRSAEVADLLSEAAVFGVKAEVSAVDYPAAVSRMRGVVENLREGVSSVLRGVDVVAGEARFISPKEVEAAGEVFTADKIIIATGSVPAALPIEGAELAMSSDDLLAADTLPESLVIVGGGVIGMEFACVMNSFGVKVTVIEYCKEILPPFDRDIAKRLHSQLSRKGINIITGASVKSLHRCDDGAVETVYEGKKGEERLRSSAVLMAVGRRPALPEGLDKAGVEYNDRKGITVDDSMLTTAEGIYAIGDVNGRCMLAHAASAQGRVVLGEEVNMSVIPSAVFTVPEVAMTGLTEEQCKADGLDYKVAKAMFGANGKALALGEASGLVKLIYSPLTGEIFGCHILGPHASDLIQEPATVMSTGMGVKTIAGAIHAHPTLGEVVAQAARQSV